MADIPEPYRELAKATKALIEALGRAQELTVDEEERVDLALRAIGMPPDWSVR